MATLSSSAIPPIIPADTNNTSANVADTLMTGDLIVKNELVLGKDSDLGTNKCVTIKLKSAGAIGANLMLKIVDVGGEARVTPLLAADGYEVIVVGMSGNAVTAADEDVTVCIGGIFTAVVENTNVVAIGDALEKSTVEDGRIVGGVPAQGTFGVVLTAGTGDIAGTVTVQGMFMKNETF